MRPVAWPGNQRASASDANVPALHDDTNFYVERSGIVENKRFEVLVESITTGLTR